MALLQLVQPRRRTCLAHHQTGELIPAQEAPEMVVAEAFPLLERALHVSPPDGGAPQEDGGADRAESGAGGHVNERRAHEELAEAVTPPPGDDALLAGAHRSQVDEAQRGLVPAACDPAQHAAAV